MKSTLFIFCLSILMIACTQQKRGVSLSITNPNNFDRLSELVEIPKSELDKNMQLKDSLTYLVINDRGETIPSQLTYEGNLIFPSNLKAKEEKSYTIVNGKSENYISKVFSCHHPERYDDFAWENDKVGFRFYGKALEAIQAPTSGLDLWYKRTDKLVLDKWYQKDFLKEASYHEDHGEGCDPYAVSQTLGGGSMSPIIDSIIYLNNNYLTYDILDNGPLRTTFKLFYPNLKIGNNELTETKTISLDAGSQFTKIVQEYTGSDNLQVAAGFPKRELGDSTIHTKGNDYFVYQEPMSEKDGQIYLGIIIPSGIDDVLVSKSTYNQNTKEIDTKLPNTIATANYQARPLTYYTGFGWNKFGFEDITAFEKHIRNFSITLKEPLKITYK